MRRLAAKLCCALANDSMLSLAVQSTVAGRRLCHARRRAAALDRRPSPAAARTLPEQRFAPVFRTRETARPRFGHLRKARSDNLRRLFAPLRPEDALGRSWVLCEPLRWSDRPPDQLAAPVWAAAAQHRLATHPAERAFIRANQRVHRLGRQILVAAFAVGTQLQHVRASWLIVGFLSVVPVGRAGTLELGGFQRGLLS